METPDDESSELLKRLIQVASRFTLRDPTAIEDTTNIATDEWSSNDEIESARKRSESALMERHEAMDLQEEFGGSLEENLISHSAFTLSLLERLCNAINDSVSLASNENIISSLITTREFHAAKLLWRDRVTKLSTELIAKNAQIATLENAKRRIERKYDKAVLQIKELEATKATDGKAGSSSAAVNGQMKSQ